MPFNDAVAFASPRGRFSGLGELGEIATTLHSARTRAAPSLSYKWPKDPESDRGILESGRGHLARGIRPPLQPVIRTTRFQRAGMPVATQGPLDDRRRSLPRRNYPLPGMERIAPLLEPSTLER